MYETKKLSKNDGGWFRFGVDAVRHIREKSVSE
jgi:hypothetical protein